MKIAMFTDAYYPRINGVTVSVHSYATELSKLGHEVCIVCLEYTEEQQKSSFFDEKESDESSPFKVVRIPSWSMGLLSKEDRIAKFDKWRRVKKAMDSFRPNVIHINTEWVIGYFGALYALHRKVPFVFTFHTMWEDYLINYVNFLPELSLRRIGRSVVKFYLKRADVIIAPTQKIASVVHDYGIQKNAEILPTGIPDGGEKYSIIRQTQISMQLSKKCPQIKGKKILLFVGRIVKEKNLSFLYDVLELVQKKNPKTALLFVGGGPYLEELKELAQERGLSKSVAFSGYIPSNDIVYFYKLAQVFVFPSKTETQGLVTVEAMLAGIPVVAIGELGTVDVMQGDHGGFMVEDNPVVFADKVLQLLNNQQLRKQKSQEALKWGEKWKISALTPRLVECYVRAVHVRCDKNLGIVND
ncbi:glycosyltransferase [uncultured Treponema sp.]|uniref:glycosyltransferase n=1 Tax=uncultured Treponema sp. TaxID=162155 RepID=UPI0025DEDE45|nr:glycosyltransferase [uncultured Treponema sp.]